MGAVIDERAFAKHKAALERAKADDAVHRRRRRHRRRQRGLLRPPDGPGVHRPDHEIFTTEYFGPILGVHVYEDATYDDVLAQMESRGAVRADRRDHRPGPRGDRDGAAGRCGSPPATSTSTTSRPARSSGSSRSAARGPRGTNDKAGAPQNLMRWTSTRSIKETFVPPTDHRYPHMG